MNILQQYARLGQSIWYDNISRRVLLNGELAAMVAEGCRGVTSNPTIFDKAISGSTDYDGQIKEILAADPRTDVGELIRALMVRDIQLACDILRTVYDTTRGRDGFVSIEVTPSKARDTAATIAEVRELWTRVSRPNLMIKIPATLQGLPAITQAIADGTNVNVTLIFSETRYREVAAAYISGLEQRLAGGKSIGHIASVASVFVSRVDTLVDEILQKRGAPAGLAGRAAVANTKMIYQAYRQIFGGDRFKILTAKGATPQRPLWGSTGTKNPAYSDLLYVDTLVGPDTVNTVPPATYAAILDHGKPSLTLEADLGAERKLLADIAAAGIDMDAVLKKLEDDGVAAFEKSFDSLYASLAKKKEQYA